MGLFVHKCWVVKCAAVAEHGPEIFTTFQSKRCWNLRHKNI